MRNLDFSDWQSFLTTLIGLALFTLIGIGIRLLAMFTIQQRRERMNRQINERLRTLIAAYRTLGGSFTGELSVSPLHLRDLRSEESRGERETPPERARRIRDAVEAALSDIILLGTEEQVKLASAAAQEMVAGRPIHVHELVVSLRNFIREALDLDPIAASTVIPAQGPLRPSASGGRGRGDKSGDDASGRSGGRGQGGGGQGGAGLAGAGAGMGIGSGLGAGLSAHHDTEDEDPHKP